MYTLKLWCGWYQPIYVSVKCTTFCLSYLRQTCNTCYIKTFRYVCLIAFLKNAIEHDNLVSWSYFLFPFLLKEQLSNDLNTSDVWFIARIDRVKCWLLLLLSSAMINAQWRKKIILFTSKIKVRTAQCWGVDLIDRLTRQQTSTV